MDTKLIKVETLQDIADAIKEKEATDDLIPVEEYAERIRGIEGGKVRLQEKVVTPSAERIVVQPDKGYGGFSSVTIEGDEDLKAENIAEGVEIYGVTGTHTDRLVSFIKGEVTEITESELAGMEAIPNYAFYEKPITRVVFPQSVKTIGDYAFAFSGNRVPAVAGHLDFSTGVETIGKYAFNYCKNITSVDFSKSVKKIDNYAFHSCDGIKVFDFPENVETLGADVIAYTNADTYIIRNPNIVFAGRVMSNAGSSIANKEFILMATTPPKLVDAYCFSSNMGQCPKILVPVGCGEAYKTATNWSKWATKIYEDPRAGNINGGGTENWLFQNEQITSEGRTDLPSPVDGVSYTAFVDGEEVCTSTCEGGVLNFNTEDYRIYLICDASTGLGWHFHPVDSEVQSGSVSIRINE